MSILTRLARSIFASHDSAGVARAIVPAEAATWGTEIEAIIDNAFVSGSSVLFTSLASLNANLGPPATTIAWVMGDSTAANNGIYQKLGESEAGSWVRRGDLPYSFISATNGGAGTANAIVATTAIPLPASDGGALIVLPIVSTNTASPVTVAFNGGAALTIKTVSGSNVPIGGLPDGALVVGYRIDATFQLISDYASPSLIATLEVLVGEAEDAAAAAQAAASSVQLTEFPTLAAAESYAPATGPDMIRTAGYTSAGDAGAALYKKVASEPSHAGKFSITLDDAVTVVWYEIAEPILNPVMFGAAGDGSTDDGAALRALAAALQDGDTVAIPRGTFRVYVDSLSDSVAITVPNVTITGPGTIKANHADVDNVGKFPIFNILADGCRLAPGLNLEGSGDIYLYQVNALNDLQGLVNVGEDVQNGEIYGFESDGVEFINPENCGIVLRQTWAPKVLNCSLQGQYPDLTGEVATYGYNHQGIVFLGCEAFTADNNTIWGFVEGITSGGTVVADPMFDKGVGQPDIESIARNGRVTDNDIYGWWDHAIYMSLGVSCTISGNKGSGDYRYRQGGAEALKLTGDGCIVHGNEFKANGGLVVAKIGTGISTDRPIVTDNVFEMMNGQDRLHFGINVSSAPGAIIEGNQVSREFTQDQGFAQGWGATAIKLDTHSWTVNDIYNGGRIIIVRGTGAGQERTIVDYVGSTQVAEVATWDIVPDATSEYSLRYEITDWDPTCYGITINNSVLSAVDYPPENCTVAGNKVKGRMRRLIGADVLSATARVTDTVFRDNQLDGVDLTAGAIYALDIPYCTDVDFRHNKMKNVVRGINVTDGIDVHTEGNETDTYSQYGVLTGGTAGRTCTSINDRASNYTGADGTNALRSGSGTVVRMGANAKRIDPFDKIYEISSNALSAVTIRWDDPRTIVVTQSASPGLTLALDTLSGFLEPGAQFTIINKISGGTTPITVTGPGSYSETVPQGAVLQVAISATNTCVTLYRDRPPLTNSATYDPASIADAAGVTTTIACTGAALGDFAQASFSNALQGITLTAWVSAADVVSVRFQNESGGVLDLASGTLRVRVTKAA